MSQWPIYLDHAATTPVDPAVAALMYELLTATPFIGNAAASTHAYGREAAGLVGRARQQVAALIGAQSEDIVFTSGATESDNLALLGVMRANADRGRHLVTSRTEHKAVTDVAKRLEKEGFAVSWLEPDRDGIIEPALLRAALRPDTQLVSIMQANNETGVLQDIDALGAICRERDVLFHCDAAQSAGLLALDMRSQPVDLLSFTAHKFGGPKGIGALYVAPRARPRLQPLLFGGGHERGLRPGTPATHQVAGFGLAAELAHQRRAADAACLCQLRDALQARLLALPGSLLNGYAERRLPNLLNVSFEGVMGESLLADIEAELAVSSGAACDSATGEPSYVLRSLGRSSQLAQSSLRLSLGRRTTAADIERAGQVIGRSLQRLRAVAPGAGTVRAGSADAVCADAGRVDGLSGSEGPRHDPLSPLVRQLFRELPHAGCLPASSVVAAARVLRGEAGRESDGARVIFHIAVSSNDRVTEVRFQAYGCPHTLATAAWLAGQLQGRSLADLLPGAPPDWARTLSVPVEKLGRLLTIEDALRALA